MPTLEEFMRVDRPWTRKEQQLIAAQSESQYNLRQKAVDLVRDQFIGSHALRQIQANWGQWTEESVFGDTPWDPEAKPFVMTEEFLDELSRDDQGNPMPADYLGEFENARSPDHARQIRRGLLPLIESRNRLNQLGWGGIAARMAAAILDPAAITLEVVTLGRATPAIYGGRASRLTKALKMGLVTSATIGGFEAALAGLDPERGATDVVYAAAGSFVMGAGLGRILDKRLTEAGRGVMRQQQFQEIRKIAGLELTPKGKKYYRTQLDPQAQTKAMRAAISQLDLHPEDAAALEEIVSNPEQLRHLMPDLNDTDTRTPSAQPPSQQDFVNGPVFVYDLNLTGRRTQPRYDPKTGNVVPDDPNTARVTISDEAAEVAPAAGEDVQQLARETNAALNAFIDKNPGMDPMAARAAFDATPEGKALNARLETARRTAAAPDEAAGRRVPQEEIARIEDELSWTGPEALGRDATPDELAAELRRLGIAGSTDQTFDEIGSELGGISHVADTLIPDVARAFARSVEDGDRALDDLIERLSINQYEAAEEGLGDPSGYRDVFQSASDPLAVRYRSELRENIIARLKKDGLMPAAAPDEAAGAEIGVFYDYGGVGTTQSKLQGTKTAGLSENNPSFAQHHNVTHGTDFKPTDANLRSPEDVAKSGAKVYIATPECTQFTIVNRFRKISKNDVDAAAHVARVIDEARPPVFLFENVKEYQGTKLFKTITDALDRQGYKWKANLIDSADYGGVQSRKRLIVRAVRDGEVPKLPKKTKSGDWWEAVKDLVDNAPDTKAGPKEMASIQRMIAKFKRANPDEKGIKLDPNKPIITMGGSMGKTANARGAGGPSPTLASTGKAVPRIILPPSEAHPKGRVIKVTGAMMLRLMGLPDDTPLPKSVTVGGVTFKDHAAAKVVLGNGVQGTTTDVAFQPMIDLARSQRRAAARAAEPDAAAARVAAPDKAAVGESVEQLAVRKEYNAALKTFREANEGMDEKTAAATFGTTPEGKELNARMGAAAARRADAAPDVTDVTDEAAEVAPDVTSEAGLAIEPETAPPRRGKGWREWIQGLRFDMMGDLINSKVAAVRDYAHKLAENPWPQFGGAPAMQSASEWAYQIRNLFYAGSYRKYNVHLGEYFKNHKIPWIKQPSAKITFSEEVTHAMRRPAGTYTQDAAINAAADHYRQLFAQLLRLAKKFEIKGFSDIPENAQYIPRIWSIAKIQKAGTTHPPGSVEEAFAIALVQGSDSLGLEDARKVAKSVVSHISEGDWQNEVQKGRVFDSESFDELKQILTEQGIKDDVIDSIMNIGAPAEPLMSRARRRMDIDETAHIQTTAGKLTIESLMENNVEALYGIYANQIIGAAAMKRFYQSIGKNVSSFDTVIKHIEDIAKKMPVEDRPAIKWQIKKLIAIQKTIEGIPLEESNEYTRLLKQSRALNYMRVMNQVGFAQVAEIGTVVGEGHLNVALRHMPSLRQIWSRARDGEMNNDLIREIEHVWASGTDWMRDQAIPGFDRGEAMMELTGGAVDLNLRRGQRVTNAISGFATIDMALQRMAGILAVQRFADIAVGGRVPSKFRLHSMGLTQADAARISDQMQLYGSFVDGWFGKKRVRRINIEKWENIELRDKFIVAVDKWSRRAVQRNDIGNLSLWMTTWYGRVIVHFRSFVAVAWNKQLLYGIAAADRETFAAYSLASLFAALSYTAQTYVNSIGRLDRKEYLRERLSKTAVAAAAFQRAGYASLIPGAIDTGLWFTGSKPAFSYGRSTGLATNLVSGNPTMDQLNILQKAVRGVFAAPFKESEFSQQDLNYWTKAMPFGNAILLSNGIKALGADLPEKSR